MLSGSHSFGLKAVCFRIIIRGSKSRTWDWAQGFGILGSGLPDPAP